LKISRKSLHIDQGKLILYKIATVFTFSMNLSEFIFTTYCYNLKEFSN
jgi:hypothetical protein